MDYFCCWHPPAQAPVLVHSDNDDNDENEVICDQTMDNIQEQSEKPENQQLVRKNTFELRPQEMFLFYGVIIPIGLFFYNLVNGGA